MRYGGWRRSSGRERWSSETIFDLANRRQELEHLDIKAAEPNLWEDGDAATAMLQKLSQLRDSITPVIDLQKRTADLLELAEMADPDMAAELSTEAESIQAEMGRIELLTLLSGPHDADNAIVEINSGAGGTESCDWALMLLRMYLRWTQEKGYKVEVIDEVSGDVAGIKSTTFDVIGPNAFGWLKAEKGVHRLVRISPFDANKRRHTSFASVDVIPEVPETEEIQINADDLRVDTYRSSGAGGQHVNKTDSAVRITHLPTGIVVAVQNERSQHKNRAMAMKILQARLVEREMAEQEAKMAVLRGEQQSIEWGNQIRSYVFQPYTLVKDHRTGHETGDIIRVMDGALDPFMQAFLQWKGGKNGG